MAKFFIVVIFASLAAFPVLSQNDEVKIEPTGKVLYLKEGQAQMLKCSATVTDEKKKLKWVHPSSEGVKSVEQINRSGGNISLDITLQITDFAVVNSGEYKCQLLKEDSMEKEKTISLLTVKENKTEPIFVEDSPNVTLSCGISVDQPVKSVTWSKVERKDGVKILNPIKDLKDFSYSEKSDNAVSSLIISNPKIDAAGLYTALFELENSSFYPCDVEFQAGPSVQEFLKSKNIIQGEKMELRCIVKGYPPPAISWLKNNETRNFTLLSNAINEQVAQLFVESVDFGDSGDYICTAHSATLNRTSSQTLTVKVKDKLAALWPFLGIVAEVIVLCTIIFIYEKRRNRQVQLEEKAAEEVDGSATDKKEGLRHRNTNPTA